MLITQKDYSIAWLIHGSYVWSRCEYRYTFGDPKYRSAPVIVVPWCLWRMAFECWGRQPSSTFQVVRYDPEDYHVSTSVDKNGLTQSSSTLHSHFSTQGESKGQRFKELWHDLVLKLVHFQMDVRQTLLFLILLWVWGTTKTGVCCNECRNPTNINGEVLMFPGIEGWIGMHQGSWGVWRFVLVMGFL